MTSVPAHWTRVGEFVARDVFVAHGSPPDLRLTEKDLAALLALTASKVAEATVAALVEQAAADRGDAR